VIAPETAPETKISAIERLCARVLKVSYDDWWRAFEERRYPGLEGVFVHAFDDLNVMAGNGTIGIEILEDLADVDAVVIPWGGGGLACGIASALRELKPATKIFAAEVATAAPLLVAWKTGTPQVIPTERSFVDGIGGKSVFPRMFERAKRLLDGVLVARLNEVAAAVRLLAERNRIIAEGAGATPVACALAGGAGTGKVVCVVSGGNIDLSKLVEIFGTK
jgi:threonine dehydratase